MMLRYVVAYNYLRVVLCNLGGAFGLPLLCEYNVGLGKDRRSIQKGEAWDDA